MKRCLPVKTSTQKVRLQTIRLQVRHNIGRTNSSLFVSGTLDGSRAESVSAGVAVCVRACGRAVEMRTPVQAKHFRTCCSCSKTYAVICDTFCTVLQIQVFINSNKFHFPLAHSPMNDFHAQNKHHSFNFPTQCCSICQSGIHSKVTRKNHHAIKSALV